MKWFVIENTWLKGYGWGNGYVVIPKGHPLHGKDYWDYDLDVNGGVTFADWGSAFKDQRGVREDDWVIGFDTAHSFDSIERWPKSEVVKETKRLARLVDEYQP